MTSGWITTETQRGKAASFQRSAFSGQGPGARSADWTRRYKNLCVAQRNEELVVQRHGEGESQRPIRSALRWQRPRRRPNSFGGGTPCPPPPLWSHRQGRTSCRLPRTNSSGSSLCLRASVVNSISACIATETQRGKAVSFQRSAFSGQGPGARSADWTRRHKNLCVAQRNEELVVQRHGEGESQRAIRSALRWQRPRRRPNSFGWGTPCPPPPLWSHRQGRTSRRLPRTNSSGSSLCLRASVVN